MKNLNLLFNKTYYDKISVDHNHVAEFKTDIGWKNEALFGTTFQINSDYKKSPLEGLNGYRSFVLATTYPGMLVGTGYGHGAQIKVGDVDAGEDEIKLGFSFDYTSGQPYIPGSTVKGVLRSAFAHPEMIQELCPSLSAGSVSDLEKRIFAEEGKDVFLDAVIRSGDNNSNILGSDYITPHSSPIKSPIPVMMLKILPDVSFEFRFVLQDTTLPDGTVVSADEKKKLFKGILEIMGIGAKTNVGYGALRAKNGSSVAGGNAAVQSTPATPVVEITEVKCACGTTNYKYKPNSRTINPGWARMQCRNCKRALRIPEN